MKRAIIIFSAVLLITAAASAYTLSGTISGGVSLGGITYVYAVSTDTSSSTMFYIGLAILGNGNYAVLNVPQGEYVLFAYQDRDNNLLPSPNDYYGFYGDTLPEVLSVAQNMNGLNIAIAPFPLTFIQGTISYASADTGLTIVQISTVPDFTDMAYFSILLDSTGTGEYTAYADSGTYYVRAFMDKDLNFQYTPELEPMGYYGYPNAPIPVYVSPGNSASGVDIVMYVGVDKQVKRTPEKFDIYPAFPNPFNGQTQFSFNLRESSEVKVELFDIRGNLLSVIADGIFPAGMNRLKADMKSYPSGVYFINISGAGLSSTQKIMLLK